MDGIKLTLSHACEIHFSNHESIGSVRSYRGWTKKSRSSVKTHCVSGRKPWRIYSIYILYDDIYILISLPWGQGWRAKTRYANLSYTYIYWENETSATDENTLQCIVTWVTGLCRRRFERTDWIFYPHSTQPGQKLFIYNQSINVTKGSVQILRNNIGDGAPWFRMVTWPRISVNQYNICAGK